MKKLYTLLALVITLITNAQAPQGFNYQATVRNSAGALIVNQNVLVKFNVYQNAANGTIVYSENQSVTTDDLGHINLVVGQGTSNAGTFTNINWGSGSYFLGIELNTGSGYLDMGTTQLMSVPYALYSSNGTPGPQGPAGPQGIQGIAGPTGADGPQGLPGTNGVNGATGAQGVTGPQGPIGLTGAAGATGLQGIQGLTGANGAQGIQGEAGPTGATGSNGADGKNPIIKTSTEAAGVNCTTGGTKVEVGLDTNSNGVLDTAEINTTLTRYVCNGIVGATGAQGIQGSTGPSDGAPAASIISWSGPLTSTITGPYLLCDGSNVSRTTYSELFNVIGTTYGIGDGINTFTLPNIQSRVISGYDSTDSNFNSIGLTGGTSSNTLVANNLPTHTHSATTTVSNTATTSITDPGHSHLLVYGGSVGANRSVYGDYLLGGPINIFTPPTPQANTASAASGPAVAASTTTGITASTSVSSTATTTVGNNTTTNTAVTNLQPYIVMRYYIKYSAGNTSIGATGPQGIQGIQGVAGPTGATGVQGIPGNDGATGPQGVTGPQGLTGTNGTNGLSAYQIWLNAGNTGTEAQFLTSLQGAQGVAGPQGPAGSNGTSVLGAGFYQITLNMSGGIIDIGGTPIASVLGPNGEDKATLEGLGWSFSTPTSTRLTVGRPSSLGVQPIIDINTHAVTAAGNVVTSAVNGKSITALASFQTLSSGTYTTLEMWGLGYVTTGGASSGTATTTVTFGLIR